MIIVYESPIKIVMDNCYNQIETHIENSIMKSITTVNINVDRDELIAALNYDRNQYTKGYEDGKNDAVTYGKWEINSDGYYPYCSVCGEEPENGKMTNYCPNCGARMKG